MHSTLIAAMTHMPGGGTVVSKAVVTSELANECIVAASPFWPSKLQSCGIPKILCSK